MRKIFEVLFSKDNVDEYGSTERNILIYGSLFFVLVSCILSGLNIYKQYWFMAGTTVLLAAGFTVSAILAVWNKTKATHILIAVLCAVIFSVYAITGENEGFAILWILLVPIIGMLLVGLKVGFLLSMYFQIFLIVLFYTPLSGFVKDYYTETFIMRFPLLYFGTFGVVTYLMCQRQELHNRVHRQACFDALTDLHNRYDYNEFCKSADDMARYPHLTVLSMDLNRLKYTNDTLGHDAGDEIIKGTADLIRGAFPTAMCFRTGGDEFVVAVIKDDAEKQLACFKENMEAWHGALSPSLNVSVGLCSRDESPEMSFAEMVRKAEQRMYDEKAAFYQRSGFERRRSEVFKTETCSS